MHDWSFSSLMSQVVYFSSQNKTVIIKERLKDAIFLKRKEDGERRINSGNDPVCLETCLDSPLLEGSLLRKEGTRTRGRLLSDVLVYAIIFICVLHPTFISVFAHSLYVCVFSHTFEVRLFTQSFLLAFISPLHMLVRLPARFYVFISFFHFFS